MKRKSILTLLVVLPVFLVTACQLKVPIREMVQALQSINEAKKYMAEKYAPAEVKKAETFLYESHVACKKEKVDKCRQDALKSLAASRLALDKSLPPLAKETSDRAAKELKVIEGLNAPTYAPKFHADASATLKDALAAAGQKKYRVSYRSSLASLEASGKAREKCLAQVPQLQTQIRELTSAAADLKKESSDEVLRKELSTVEKNLSLASAAIEKNILTDASSLITTATIRIKEVSLSIRRKKLADEISAIKSEAATIRNARGADFATDELEQLSASLEEGEVLLEKNQFDESKKKITEARELLATARNKTESGIASEKLKSVQLLHDQITSRDKENLFKEKLDETAAMLKESGKLIDEKSYSDSLQKSVAAESLLNSLTVAMEKALTIKAEKAEKGRGEGEILEKGTIPGSRVYVVRYRRKNTDCLWRISLEVYKDARLWPRIYLANKEQIKDPDLIFPGQRFVIPPLKSPEAEGKKTSDEAIKKEKSEEKTAPEEKKASEDKETPEEKGTPEEKRKSDEKTSAEKPEQ